MNDNYDDEYDLDEDYEDYDELSNIDQSSNYYTRPPKTGKIMRDVGNGIKQAGKKAASKAASALLNGLKQLFVAIISNPYVLGILAAIIIIALIWIAISHAITDRATDAVREYIMNSDSIDPLAKSLYEERHSLLLLKLSEINDIYDAFMQDKQNAGDIKTAMKTVMGINEVESKKATQYNTSSTVSVSGYNTKFNRGSDGVRDDERVKIITGSGAPINSYKQNGIFQWSNGYVSTIRVELVDITVPVWTGSYGSQTSSTASLKVNSKLKDIIKAMFEDIYNDPSKPVINDVHCFRESDGYSGHVFAAAIDINPDQNPMPGQYGSMSNYQPGTNKLSMDSNHPIVKIIRDKYGWDWGGDWNSTKDYMHFSFMGG